MHTKNDSNPEPNAEIRTAIDCLNRCILDKKLTQLGIAATTGINQSQVSRILNGDFRRPSKNVLKLCSYANSFASVDDRLSPATNHDLMSALELVWDGTDQHARALANVIRSLSSLHY
jgi:transcriptional regulator with XRE-family HTH domain